MSDFRQRLSENLWAEFSETVTVTSKVCKNVCPELVVYRQDKLGAYTDT